MDDSGLTYSLEAMLGILLIAGVVVFVTASPPPIAEPSGKYSKIQLVNLGEDILSLIASTPFRDTDANETPLYNNVSQGRSYTLVTNKTHIAKNENMSFKIYYLGNESGNENLAKELLTYNYPNGTGSTSSGTFNLNFSEEKEYQVQAYNSSKFSNNVTIYVGYYLLLLNAYGIRSSDTIRGIVTKSGEGVGNLSINIYENVSGNLILRDNTNRTQEGGRFSLKWAWGTGKFYINASNGTNSSNLKELDVKNDYVLSIDKNHVFETRNVTLTLTNSSGGPIANQSSSDFLANDQTLNALTWVTFTDIDNGKYNLSFKRAGDYVIQYKKNPNESNQVLVNVHPMESYLASPLSYFLGTGDLAFGDLKKLVGPYIPANMDYNLYLYRVSGDSVVEEENLFPGKIPSRDAVVVSRLVRSEAVDGTGVPRELRIVLWYR